MQRATTVRYTAKPGRADENEALSRAVFTELRTQPRAAFAYAVLRQGDDFLHVFVNLEADDSGALVDLPSFAAFNAGSQDRWTGTPQIERHSMTLLDAFGFTGV
jgi:hypothetical protein